MAKWKESSVGAVAAEAVEAAQARVEAKARTERVVLEVRRDGVVMSELLS
jgi:hypothetical protein